MRTIGISVALLIVGMLSIQFGATLAKNMFLEISPAVITMIRTSFAALFLLALMRPWREPMQGWSRVILYGVTLGVMNLLFYSSLKRIPLGIAVALEFVGPLGVALLGSRRLVDILWVALAGVGIYLLLPMGEFSKDLDGLGVFLALAAGVCWGLYIIFGKRAGAVASMQQATAWGMVFAALTVMPFGLYELDPSIVFSGKLWAKGIVVAILSSALPYTLEMMVLRIMDPKTFGTLMSIEPALAALMGLIFLNEFLDATQVLAMAAIVAACLGATLTAPAVKPSALDGVN